MPATSRCLETKRCWCRWRWEVCGHFAFCTVQETTSSFSHVISSSRAKPLRVLSTGKIWVKWTDTGSQPFHRQISTVVVDRWPTTGKLLVYNRVAPTGGFPAIKCLGVYNVATTLVLDLPRTVYITNFRHKLAADYQRCQHAHT